MTLIEKRKEGQDYFSNKLYELASAGNVRIDSLDWNDSPSQSWSEITVTQGDKKSTYCIDKRELEIVNFRTELDRKVEHIIVEFR